jgi:hypothetical protein
MRGQGTGGRVEGLGVTFDEDDTSVRKGADATALQSDIRLRDHI